MPGITAFQTNLSDEEWKVIEPHLPVPKATGHPRLRPLREILLDGVFYVLKNDVLGACSPRLPTLKDSLPLPLSLAHLRHLGAIGLDPTPKSAGAPPKGLRAKRRYVDDSQSVKKTTGVGGQWRAYDLAKKVKSHKRQLLVDTEGLMLKAKVHSRPQRRWVWVPEGQDPSPPRPVFTVLARRWIVERSFSWLGQNRRMSKDYKRLPESSELLFILVAVNRLMARRLARS